MSTIAIDLRFAFRQMKKAPGFTLTVVLTLALGMGATTAVFSVVEGILMRPLPFTDPERLVLVGDHIGAGPDVPVTPREIGTYAAASSAFASSGGYISQTYELSGDANPEEIRAVRFTAGVFPTLQVNPLIGRVFTQQEDESHQPLAVISYALWLNRYNRDPHVIGRSIRLDRKAYTIIGVMPRSFEFPLQPGHLNRTQLWVPMSFTPDELSDAAAGFWGYHMVARLKSGVTLQQAAQDADRVARQIMREFPAAISAIHIRGDVMPLRESSVASVGPLLRTLFLAVAIVMLIACMNVAGLLLLRAIRRHREYAVRLALGARSGVIVRESLLEALLLNAIAGLLGLALAALVIRTCLHFLPESMPRMDAISLNGTVAAFCIVLALASGILCSLAPTFAALRTPLMQSLKEGSQTGTGAASHSWLRSTLVVSEIGIALVLLTVSGVFCAVLRKCARLIRAFILTMSWWRIICCRVSTTRRMLLWSHSIMR